MKKVREARVSEQVPRYKGMVHGFVPMADMIDKDKLGIAEASTELKKASREIEVAHASRANPELSHGNQRCRLKSHFFG